MVKVVAVMAPWEFFDGLPRSVREPALLGVDTAVPRDGLLSGASPCDAAVLAATLHALPNQPR